MSKRKEKRDFIIENARATFLQKGFFNTVMDDIADRVGLTRRTLYRYFESKEDLAYETTIQLINEWNIYQRTVFNELNGSGIQQFETFLNYLIDYMSKRIDVMKYLGEFDFYFKDENITKPSTESIARFNEIILESDGLLTQIMELGQRDRSIKENLDIKLSVATISNILWSFGQRIAIRSEMIKEESGLDGLQLIKNQVSLYIMAIKEVNRNEGNSIT